MDIEKRFDAVDGDYLKFDLVSEKLNKRPDLHAFIYLDKLFPVDGRDIISAASHDEIWLDVSEENIEKLTDADILELTRCGVRYCNENDSLAMFA